MEASLNHVSVSESSPHSSQQYLPWLIVNVVFYTVQHPQFGDTVRFGRKPKCANVSFDHVDHGLGNQGHQGAKEMILFPFCFVTVLSLLVYF